MPKLNVIAEPNTHEVSITRMFDAPPELVFKAYTDPKIIPQWWGPHSTTTTVDKMEAKAGGAWQYTHTQLDGQKHRFYGVYHEVKAPERIVYTFEFDGAVGHVLLETITFEQENGKTKMTDSMVFQTTQARDAMLKSGMEQGVNESMERLDEVLAQSK